MERATPGNFSVLLVDLLRVILQKLTVVDVLALRQTCKWFNHFITKECNQYWFFICFPFLVYEMPNATDFLHHSTYYPLCGHGKSCREKDCPKFFVPYVTCYGSLYSEIVGRDDGEYDEEFSKRFKDCKNLEFKEVYVNMRMLDDTLGGIDGYCLKSSPEHWDYRFELHSRELLELAYDPAQNYFVAYARNRIRHHHGFDHWERNLSRKENDFKRWCDQRLRELQQEIDQTKELRTKKLSKIQRKREKFQAMTEFLSNLE